MRAGGSCRAPTLAFSLLLALAIALLAPRPGRPFLLMGMNGLLHLLLDACQVKWANGAHLFAPLDWRLTNFGLFWVVPARPRARSG